MPSWSRAARPPKFIRAVNAKTKRTVGADYELQDGDVIRIVANK